ncbi:MAG: AbrB/MazE/SpoVT family DNA-binding domain-containing protein [Planctomycetes bacterium]|mgnify:CR=1|nr:AbrB/MazE/SpoVT family DNA-binding domain-containing protein [Planctomycetota bacterium]
MADQWIVPIEQDGNDGLIELNAEVLARLGLKVGDEVEVTYENGGIRIAPRR